MKRIKLHIVLDIIAMWSFILISIYLGITVSALFIVFSLLLIAWFSIRTFKWVAVALDVVFRKPEKILSKGYKFSVREQAYALGITKKICYSYVFFDDSRLKGRYIFLDEAVFRHGEELEIVYYPRSKYIKSIKSI